MESHQMTNFARRTSKTRCDDPLRDLVPGYPKLAGKMNIQPETAIFRRFGRLNATNLLYLQAELTSLENELREAEVDDNADTRGEKKNYARDWYWLSQSQDDGDTKQLDLAKKLQVKLHEYNDALIQQRTILNFPEPDVFDLSNVQNFLAGPRMMCNDSLALIGEDAATWGSTLAPEAACADLVALRDRPKEDPFSEWVAKKAMSTLSRCGCVRWMKPSRVHGVVACSDTSIFRITYCITSLLASLIPLSSIVVLYCVRSMPARLSLIGIFNILVSMCLIAFTNAKRAEVFAVTAAFAAVQVVFVGTDRNGSN